MIISIIKIFRYFSYNRYSLINAMKAIIASFFGYQIGNHLGTYLGVHKMYLWIVVTILVVMTSQPNLGGAFDKARMRLIGTIIGSILSISILVIFKDYYVIKIIFCLFFIFISVFTATTIKNYSYAALLCAITVSMILFGYDSSLSFAFYRSLEVIIGILIALLTNRYILPISAQLRLGQSFSYTLIDIKVLNNNILSKSFSHSRSLKIFKSFNYQMNLYKEIKSESNSNKIVHYNNIALNIRSLYRYIRIIHDYMCSYPQKKYYLANKILFSRLHNDIDENIDILVKNFREKHIVNIPIKNLIRKARNIKNNFNSTKYNYDIGTFNFALKMIVRSINNIYISQKKL